MFSTPPRTLNPLVTNVESLASSCFWKIAALFAKLQRLAHGTSRQCIILRPSPGSSRKRSCRECRRIKIGHSADDYALVRQKLQQIRKRLHWRLRLSVLSSGQAAPCDGRLSHNDVFTIGCPRSGSTLSVPRGIFAPGSQRIYNTCAISLANRLAARSAHEETKTALVQIINRLHALAASHQMLRPPLTTALADLSANLTLLCHAMTSSRLAERGIELHLTVTEPIMLDAKRCWRAELIISEFITNAERHAFMPQTGLISVAVETAAGQIICGVSDNGSPTAALKRGLGSELIDALAADLDGYVERIHTASGTTITLFFPKDVEPPTEEVKNHACGQCRRGQTAIVAD